ncbi:MAG: AAA family ATPase [Gammaproteobacteria bacterium]
MIPRHLAPLLRTAAAQYPIVSVTGPRQSGKTTLVRATFPAYDYVSLEAPDHRAFALHDPRGFLRQFDGPVILDEVQKTPEMFSYLQGVVDEEQQRGRQQALRKKDHDPRLPSHWSRRPGLPP